MVYHFLSYKNSILFFNLVIKTDHYILSKSSVLCSQSFRLESFAPAASGLKHGEGLRSQHLNRGAAASDRGVAYNSILMQLFLPALTKETPVLCALPQTKRKCLKLGNEVAYVYQVFMANLPFYVCPLHVTFVLCKKKKESSGLL